MPAIAVIDSQNVRYWGERVLGVEGRVSPKKVRAAMAQYGYDIQHTYVGLAVWQKRASPNALEKSRLRADADQYRSYLESLDDVTPLVGHFARQGGRHVEKQVDVLLAIEVVLAEASAGQTVLLLSEDSDLEPALGRARARGVNAVRVVADAPFSPGSHRLWLVESGLRYVLGLDQYPSCGHRTRMAIRDLLATPESPANFVVEKVSDRGRFVARGPVGVCAVGDGVFQVGQPLNGWYVQGLAPAADDEFPRLALAERPGSSGQEPTSAIVQERASATTAFLSLRGRSGVQRMRVAPGGPSRGASVIVQPCPRRGLEWRFVAPGNDLSDRYLAPPSLGTVLDPWGKEDNRVIVESGGEKIHVLVSSGVTYNSGDRLAIWVHAYKKKPRTPVAVALSDPLPF